MPPSGEIRREKRTSERLVASPMPLCLGVYRPDLRRLYFAVEYDRYRRDLRDCKSAEINRTRPTD